MSQTTFTAVEKAAHEGAFGDNDLPLPTEAQLAAGNYRMGRVSIHGLRIAIEQPRGSIRSGQDRDGTRWSCRLVAHYGYFIGTTGADGDGVDVFVGPNPDADTAFVINQNVSGRFDEHKVVLGAVDEEHARALYRASYTRDWRGLSNIVPATIPQLKQWLRHGNKRRALTADQLNHRGTSMNRVFWNRDAQPEGLSLDQVLYHVRISDDGENLLMDSASMADIIEDSEGVLALDALVVPVNMLTRKMEAMKSVMERSGGAVKPLSVQVSEPFKQRGVTNIAALFELSDGQTVSIYFHNPDATPNRLAQTDDMISWKWLLNKKDITIVVAPEHGEDLNPREVARRVMRLAEKNSAAFQRVNAKRAERMGNIQNLKGEIADLEVELVQAQRELEAEQILLEERLMQPMSATRVTAPASPEPTDPVEAGEVAAPVYALPEGDIYSDWRGAEARDFEPNKRQMLVMTATAQAISEGLFYSNDVKSRVADILKISPELRALSKHKVEGGDVGYDVYYARKAVEAAERYKVEDQNSAALNLSAGDSLGALQVNYKRFTPCTVKAVSGAAVTVSAKAGRTAYEFTITSTQLVNAINGAASKGWRKDDAAAFIAERELESELIPAKERLTPPKAQAAAPNIGVADISFLPSADGLFLSFMPNSPKGEAAWNVINATPGAEGGKVLAAHADSTIEQLRAAGFTVAESEPSAGYGADVLLSQLAAPTFNLANITPEFAAWLSESAKPNVGGGPSPVVMAEAIELAAVSHGGSVLWGRDLTTTMDSANTPAAEVDKRDDPGAVLAGMAAAKHVLAGIAFDDTSHAIATLQNALEIVTNNEPINRAEGDIAQADLEVEAAASFRDALDKLGAPVIDVSALDSVDEDEDFDEDAEWDATPEDDGESVVLDGDFAGHPFRGNQYRKGSRTSGTAVAASINAKKVTRSAGPREIRVAHRIAHHSHLAASFAVTTRATRHYHRKMARLHAKHAGVEFSLDSVDLLDGVSDMHATAVVRNADGAGVGLVLLYQDGSAGIRDAAGNRVTPVTESVAKAEAGVVELLQGRKASNGRKEFVDAMTFLTPFLSKQQSAAMKSGAVGEEAQFFIDKAVELAATIRNMPATYEQDGKGGDAVAHLHYFRGGADWYITEKDRDGGVLQAFGLADLFGDGGELGYISIEELVANGVELDFHWAPKTVGAIQSKPEPESAKTGTEVWALPLVEPQTFELMAESRGVLGRVYERAPYAGGNAVIGGELRLGDTVMDVRWNAAAKQYELQPVDADNKRMAAVKTAALSELIEEFVALAPKGDKPHYSDLTLRALIDSYGWEEAYKLGPNGALSSVRRAFAGIGYIGGTAVPDGTRYLYAGYEKDDRSQYIALTLADDQIADWDGRDGTPDEVAEKLNAAAEKFANEARAKNGLTATEKEAGGVVGEGHDELVDAGVQAARENRIAKLLTSDYFTMDFEGDDVLVNDELRGKIEAALGEKLVEAMVPGLEAQVTLIPESMYQTTVTPTADPTAEAAAEAVAMIAQLESDKALFQSVIAGTVPNILSPSLADEMEAAFLRHESDAEVAGLFEQAVNAYQAAMLTATAAL